MVDNHLNISNPPPLCVAERGIRGGEFMKSQRWIKGVSSYGLKERVCSFSSYSVFIDCAGFIAEAWYALKLIVRNVITTVTKAAKMNSEGPSLYL